MASDSLTLPRLCGRRVGAKHPRMRIGRARYRGADASPLRAAQRPPVTRGSLHASQASNGARVTGRPRLLVAGIPAHASSYGAGVASSDSRSGSARRAARPRWLIRCFSSALSSAIVRPKRGTKKIGSYPNPPPPTGSGAT